VAALALAGCGPDGPKPPNVVIVALDTLRPDHLGCYGYERDTSPAIDAFARTAALFEQAESPAPWTAPALLSVMTSLHPSVHGVRGFPEPQRMSARVLTLAEVLRSAGYATAAFTDGGYAKGQFGLDQGFSVYPANEDDTFHEHGSNLLHPSRVRSNVDRTLQWLERHREGPFFLFFHTYEVHGPYRAPSDVVRLFRPDWNEEEEHARLAAAIERWNASREIDAAGAQLVLNHYQHCRLEFEAGIEDKGDLQRRMKALGLAGAERPISQGTIEFARDHYDAEIRYMDGELARLFAWLDSPAIAPNTIVIVVSDHGEAIGEHGKTGHGEVLHSEVLRVAMIVRAPGAAPRRIAEPVTSLDLMPTVLDLASMPFDATRLQGRSLAPLLRGEPLAPAATFSHALSRSGEEDRLFSVREGRWRLIWDRFDDRARLFDLASDPGETRDVAAEHAQVAERLLGRLRAQIDVDRSLAEAVSGPLEPYSIDPGTIDDLRELGYIDVERADAGREDEPKKPR
jgi:arylsulfatase